MFYLKSNIVSFEKISLEDIVKVEMYYSIFYDSYKVNSKYYSDILVLDDYKYVQMNGLVNKNDLNIMYTFAIKTTNNNLIYYDIALDFKFYKEINGIYYEVVELLTKEDSIKISEIFTESKNEYYENSEYFLFVK